MPHRGNSPADIIGYDGQGRPIYKGHNNGNGVRRNGNGVNRNSRMVNSRSVTAPMRRNGNSRAANANPVIRTFTAPQSPRYYKPNGQIVPVGAPLHQHQDGTIMTEHAMGPNDNSVVVTTSSPTTNSRRARPSRRTRIRGNMVRNTTNRRTRNGYGNSEGRSYGATSGE